MKNKDFAVFIMVHGRPDKMWTAETFRKAGYNGKIYYVADDLDKTVADYKDIYGEDLLVFSKEEMASEIDSGDNSKDYRSTVYPANKIFDLAKEKKCRYFMICCDDYTEVSYKFDEDLNYADRNLYDLDKVFDLMIEFYKKTPTVSIALAQGGDFIGGKLGTRAKNVQLLRKAMNTFLCSTDRPFKFIGRLNEDVTTYVNLGSKGKLFFTMTNVAINQKQHQAEKKGLTEVYLDNGTYIKSFFSVMYNPSSIKVATLSSRYKRIHHKVNWNHAVPKLLEEKHQKIRIARG